MRWIVIGVVVGYVVGTTLIYKVGPAYGCAVVGMTFGAAYLGHSERSRWLVGLFMRAIDKHMSKKEAAIVMGVHPTQIARWASGEEQAPLNKLAALPNEVIADAVTPFLDGLGFVVVPSGRLASATMTVLKLAAAVEAQTPETLPRQEVA